MTTRANTHPLSGAQIAAVVRYYAMLFGSSQRWLAPTLLYGIALAIDSAAGDSVADAYAYSAAFLVPVAAWMTRSMLTLEPAESAAMISTLVGPARARLTALSAAVGYALLCAVIGGIVATVGGSGGTTGITLAGLCTELICVLLAGLLSLGVMIARFSPADLTIRALTGVENGAALHFPLYALPFALVVTGLAWAAAVVSGTRHSV